MSSREYQLSSLLAAIAFTLLVWCALPVAAAEQETRKVVGIEPAVIKQGDTVLLTISGENMPVGTVIVEFFPQQIALLDVLSASADEIVAQVKVPSLAPPGDYNVLIYNHLGEDVFAEDALTVASEIITPVFRDYDPKSVGEVKEGFALLLMGDAITPDVVDHLAMRWRQADRELSALSTSFSAGARGQILCAVTGNIPGGELQGRVYLDDKPIYMVTVTNTTAHGIIVGHKPAQIAAAKAPYIIRFLGTDFSAGFLGGLEAELSSVDITSRPREITLVDASSISATFNGPLPSGIYELSATSGGRTIYSGEIELAAGETEVDAVTDGSIAGQGADAVQDGTGSDMAPEETAAAGPAGSAFITDIAPLVIDPGSESVSFAINATGLSASMIEALSIELVTGGRACDLLFVGSGSGHLTCLFGPPAGGWISGSQGRISIHAADEVIAPFSATVLVSGVPSVEPAVVDEQQGDESGELEWRIAGITAAVNAQSGELEVQLAAPVGAWSPGLLSGSFTLLPADAGLADRFSNLSLHGKLAFKPSGTGELAGTAAGNFISGDLLVSIAYEDHPVELLTAELAAGMPAARLQPPVKASIRRDMQTGMLAQQHLQWVIDFAPLTLTDPGFITATFDPRPDNSGTDYTIAVNGSTVIIEQDLAAWNHITDWSGGLQLTAGSHLNLDWVNGTSQSIEVVDIDPQVAGMAIRITGAECSVDHMGMSMLLEVSGGAEVDSAQLGDVELESSDLLLGSNLENFDISVVKAENSAPGKFVLQLVRRVDKLDDVAYRFLIDELKTRQKVNLSLTWPKLKYSVSEEMVIKSKKTADTNDIFI